MGITSYSKFNVFKEKMNALPEAFSDKEILSDDFILENSNTAPLSIYYSPVEYLNKDAKVLIVGITPGFRQMKKAYASVQANRTFYTNEELLHRAKMDSSYEGPMRRNLIQMLDQLGLPMYLSIKTTADLFTSKNHLVHTTGLLPYPVFYKGKNFTGSTPNIWKTPMLKRYVIECFLEDTTRLHHPLIIPLGVNVAKVLQHLMDLKMLTHTNILFGFPHPSGANGHRHKQFSQNEMRMRKMIADYFCDDSFG